MVMRRCCCATWPALPAGGANSPTRPSTIQPFLLRQFTINCDTKMPRRKASLTRLFRPGVKHRPSLPHFSNTIKEAHDERIDDEGDLWDRACRLLEKNDQDILASIRSSQDAPASFSSGVTELVELTKKKQEECEKKFWTITIKGHKIILRDCAAKVIFWLDRFKEVGDVAINFNPVSVSLPWAALRFILKVKQIPAILLPRARVE